MLIVRFLVVAPMTAALIACSQQPAEGPRPVPAHAAPGASQKVEFTAPPGWVPRTPSSTMRQAEYTLPKTEGDPEDAELVVYYFGGQGGSVQANVDRWIGQFKKPDGSPVTDSAKITRKQSHGIPLTIVDCSGTYSGGGPMMGSAAPKPNFRMLAAVAEASSGPWFFKLTGPARTVAKWEASFSSFLETIR
jgi:hypothetical protein